MVAYAALLKLHWSPSYFLSLPYRDRIFVAAALEVHGKTIAESRKNAEQRR
nr:MAG TPA: hypothetical protein [Caudoviricetes sp.]